jgi:peptidase M28-like protein
MIEPTIARERERRFLRVALLVLAALAAIEDRAQSVQFQPLDRGVIETRLRQAPAKNAGREAALKELLRRSGCDDTHLTEQPVRNERLPNVVCTLPGATPSVIIVGAHFDHVARGTGIIDNWSGASLLPSLLESLRHEPRKHTFVFIGFTAEEEGLVGSKYYARQMTPDEVARTCAMINLDSLALGPTKVWLSHSDRRLAAEFSAVAKSMKLSLDWVNADQVGDDDSEPFIKRKIPTLMVHSVTTETWPILHTMNDNPKAVRLRDYYDTYRLLAAYLAHIDTMLE